MQIYLLAVNLFALAGLLLALANFSRGTYNGRLLPLFLLVVSRSLTLIIFMATQERSQQPTLVIDALNVFSTFCLVWTLTGPLTGLFLPGPGLARLSAAGAVILSVTPLLPFWPIPSEIHSLTIAIFGASLIFTSNRRWHWTHLAASMALALAAFLSLVNFTTVSWFANLLAYAFLISSVHYESLDYYWQSIENYKGRQAITTAMAQESVNLSRERERLLEVSEAIGSVPNLNQSMEHIVSSLARAAHAEQLALFMLDTRVTGQARLMAVYNPEHPFHITSRDEITFALDDYPLLREAIEGQQQLLLPHQYMNGLHDLYALWEADKAGPTLIQPLAIQGRPVGAVVLGNPASHRPLDEGDVHLCRVLASQIATMVEHRRRYLELEFQAEAMAATLQKQMGNGESEEDLSGKLNDYMEILEVISDGVVVSDSAGRVKFANKATERILGRPRRELIGQPIGAIYGEIDSGETIEDLMVAFSRRNRPLPTFIEDDDRSIQGRLVPWRNSQGEWLGIIAIFRDVTREVKADRARDDFIAALSRELRGPLTAVKGYSELITHGAMGEYTADQLRVQRIIQSNSDQMVAVLDNAIRVSAQNKYRSLPRFEEVDIAKVVNDALREASPLASLRELTLNREIKGELPSIMADPRHIRKIVNNLLVNACKFTPPGGSVTVRAWVQPEREGNVVQSRLLLAVADTGIGIPQVDFKRIFDPFYQVKGQNVAEQKGMGMGLAVVKELVEIHRGRVWVESTVDQGTIFQVALPITQN